VIQPEWLFLQDETVLESIGTEFGNKPWLDMDFKIPLTLENVVRSKGDN